MNEWFSGVIEEYPRTWRPLTALALLFLGAAAGRVLAVLLAAYARRVAGRLKITLERDAFKFLKRYTFGMLLFWGAHEGLQVLELPLKPGRLLTGAAFALGILCAALLARLLTVLSLGWYAAEVATRTRAEEDTQFIPLIRKLATVVIYTVAVVIVLKGYGYDISTLVVSLGVGSLAIGLAMQQTLANMIAGFTIMLDRPFRVGDRVQLSTGELGDVVEIGLRSTRLLDLDLSTVIIPNTQMVNDRIINQTFPDQRSRPLLKFGVAYGTDLDSVRRVVYEVIAAQERVLKEPEPIVLFTGYGESSLDHIMRFTVENCRDAGLVVDEVGRALTKRFERDGIVIPYPVRTILHQDQAAPPRRSA